MKTLHKAAIATVLATMMVAGASPVGATDGGKGEVPVDGKKNVAPAGMITETQAIEAVKKVLGEEGKSLSGLVGSYVGASYRSRPTWFVSIEAPSPESEVQTVLHAEVDAKTGQVINFQFLNPTWVGEKMPDQETAARAADEFLKTKLPELYAKVQLSSLSGSGGAGHTTKDGKESRWSYRSVIYHELVNGIPFLENRVEVKVDEFGHVVGLQDIREYDTSKLPPRSMVVPASKAQRVLEEHVQMNKQYTTTAYKLTEQGDVVVEEQTKLGYRPNDLPEIDAISGKVVDSAYDRPYTSKREKLQLTGSNGIWVAKDKEDAKRLVSQVLKVDLSKMMFDEHKQMDPKGKDNWFFSWRIAETNDGTEQQQLYISASFDAATGRLLSASIKRPRGKVLEQPKVTMEQARSKAIDVLKTQLGTGEHEMFLMGENDLTKSATFPKWFDQTKQDYSSWVHTDNLYNFIFTKGHQGVPVVDQNYYVDLDAVTGELVGVGLARNPGVLQKLPANQNTISEAVAEQKFLDANPLRLVYVWPSFMDQKAPEGQLVYQLNQEKLRLDYIDAFTGEVVNYPANR